MRILVCVKPIADISFIEYDFASEKMISITLTLNPFDVAAIKEAINLKNRLGAHITCLSIAPPEADAVLKKVFIMGVDQCFRIWDSSLKNDDRLDAVQKATILAHFIRQIQYDLILSGARSKDWNSSWFGACLSEQLGLPFVSRVINLEVQPDGKTISVQKKMEGRWRETYRVGLPSVIGVEETANELKSLAPLKRQITVLDFKAIGIEKPVSPTVEVLKISEFRPRIKTLAATGQLSLTDRLKLISGELGKKKGQILEIGSEQGARKICEKIQELLKVK